MNLQALIALRKYLTIADHKKGKIKLNFSMKVLADNDAMTLIKEMKNQKMPQAISNSSLNLLTRSVMLEYDAQSIIPAEFDEFLTTRNRPRFEELVEKYKTVLSS